MACRNIVGIVPIDHTPGPLNGTLWTSLDACRPDTDLNASRSGRVTDNPSRIDSVGLLQGTDYGSVDQPCQGIGLPVDGIVMVIAEGVGETLSGQTIGLGGNESLPEVVCLSLGGIGTRPLPIDLILDGRHGDECSYHAAPSTCLYPRGHGSIVEVSGRGDSTSAVTLG